MRTTTTTRVEFDPATRKNAARLVAWVGPAAAALRYAIGGRRELGDDRRSARDVEGRPPVCGQGEERRPAW